LAQVAIRWGCFIVEDDDTRWIHVCPVTKDEEMAAGHTLERSCGCCPEFHGLNNYGAAILVHNMVN